MIDREYIECDCRDVRHLLCLYYSPENLVNKETIKEVLSGKIEVLPNDDVVYVYRFLTPLKGFFGRIKFFYEYLRNIERTAGDYDDMLVYKDDVLERIVSFLKKIRNINDSPGYSIDIKDKDFDFIKRSLDVDSRSNTLRFVSDKLLEKGNRQQLSVFIFLKKEKSFFKRFWRGIKYVFGVYSTLDNITDEFEIRANEAKHLIRIIENIKENNASL